DGIRDRTVTGVQTCALPILALTGGHDRVDVELETGAVIRGVVRGPDGAVVPHARVSGKGGRTVGDLSEEIPIHVVASDKDGRFRSEERRVGKEGRDRSAHDE